MLDNIIHWNNWSFEMGNKVEYKREPMNHGKVIKELEILVTGKRNTVRSKEALKKAIFIVKDHRKILEMFKRYRKEINQQKKELTYQHRKKLVI